VPVWIRKTVFAQYTIRQFGVAGKSYSNAVHLQKRECNKYDMTAAQCVSHRPIKMIRPGGLLLVVPHLFGVPVFQFYGWGYKKVNN
jgi:hypothetical protein